MSTPKTVGELLPGDKFKMSQENIEQSIGLHFIPDKTPTDVVFEKVENDGRYSVIRIVDKPRLLHIFSTREVDDVYYISI